MQRKRNTGIVKRRNTTPTDLDHSKLSMTDTLTLITSVYSAENYRPTTIRDYSYYWKEFSKIVGKEYVQEISEFDIRGYVNHLLKERELSPVTVNIRLSAIKSITNRLYKMKVIKHNPSSGIVKLRTDQQRIFTLTDKQIYRLFSVIDKTSFAGYRDYVAFLLALKCGLRSNELHSLEIIDIDFENRVILLPGAKNKNRKTRNVPFSQKVNNELQQLIAESREYFGEVTHVFVNSHGETLRNDRLRKRIDKYANEAGLKGECRASLHSLRHTFATNFLKNKGNIRSLMQIMGHADISTTQIYLDFSNDQIIQQYDEVSKNDNLDV